jgi:hypothetical protein
MRVGEVEGKSANPFSSICSWFIGLPCNSDDWIMAHDLQNQGATKMDGLGVAEIFMLYDFLS